MDRASGWLIEGVSFFCIVKGSNPACQPALPILQNPPYSLSLFKFIVLFRIENTFNIIVELADPVLIALI